MWRYTVLAIILRLPMEGDFPKSIGEFEIQRRLGEPGAYGITFLVTDKARNSFALKWMRENAPQEAPFRFENEAWALKRLNHPSIPKFVTQGEWLGRPYIVMGYVPGETLHAILERNKKEGGRVSQLQALLIAEKLLEALAYVHENGVVHRDVKHDNVLLSASGNDLTLIDFGVCKGDGAPAEGQTFWHAGASRFSPPEKVRHPAAAEPKHDVFAVGVICYLLLTNEFPWEVPKGDDSGDLRALMLAEAPQPLRSRNPHVDRTVADSISKLLTTQDHHRPTASEAAEEFRKLRTGMEAATSLTVVSNSGTIRFSRVVRDPLHGDVPMTDIETDLIDTVEFQRLRRLRQLGFSHLVYPGAEHSRFSHAIGTMHVAEKILSRIEQRTGVAFDADERLLARIFALVHDIAHAPFGHTLEDELGLFERHDVNGDRVSRILEERDSELGRVLRQTEYGRMAFDLLKTARGGALHTWVHELVTSPVGADVIDYIDRDSLFCGLDHRVDSAIFRRYAMSPQSSLAERHLVSKLYGRHGFRLDADYAIESLLRERYALFLKVYTHTTKVVAGAMLGKAIFAAREANLLEASEERIEKLGDDELLVTLAKTNDKLCSQIARAIWLRKLYMPVFRARVLAPQEHTPQHYEQRQQILASKNLFSPQGRAELERVYATKAKVKFDDIIIYATRSAPGAQKVRQYVELDRSGAKFRDEVFDPHQEIFRDHLALWQVYALANPKMSLGKQSLVAEVVQAEHQMENEISSPRRQLSFRL
jgi:HD superfamily phosphohydrolase